MLYNCVCLVLVERQLLQLFLYIYIYIYIYIEQYSPCLVMALYRCSHKYTLRHTVLEWYTRAVTVRLITVRDWYHKANLAASSAYVLLNTFVLIML